uniref:C3H1-type domain-containing protein n=1 Tax=Macrostomum lignano TaxID=282301 RepID=A0A1I8F4W4_9PLAT
GGRGGRYDDYDNDDNDSSGQPRRCRPSFNERLRKSRQRRYQRGSCFALGRGRCIGERLQHRPVSGRCHHGRLGKASRFNFCGSQCQLEETLSLLTPTGGIAGAPLLLPKARWQQLLEGGLPVGLARRTFGPTRPCTQPTASASSPMRNASCFSYIPDGGALRGRPGQPVAERNPARVADYDCCHGSGNSSPSLITGLIGVAAPIVLAPSLVTGGSLLDQLLLQLSLPDVSAGWSLDPVLRLRQSPFSVASTFWLCLQAAAFRIENPTLQPGHGSPRDQLVVEVRQRTAFVMKKWRRDDEEIPGSGYCWSIYHPLACFGLHR